MLAMVVIAVWFLFGDIVRERVRRVEFNHVVWQAGGHGTNDVRIRMVDNLLHRHNFRGATRQELTGLLGAIASHAERALSSRASPASDQDLTQVLAAV